MNSTRKKSVLPVPQLDDVLRDMPSALAGVPGLGRTAPSVTPTSGALPSSAGAGPAPGAPAAQPNRYRSAPGQLAGWAIAEHNAQARLSEFEGAQPARRLDASRIRFSRFANRPESEFGKPEYARLRATIEAAGGNEQAVGVRRIDGDPDHDYEVVYGHRRVRACREVGVPVLALVLEVSDYELMLAMARENFERSDPTVYRQGLLYLAVREEAARAQAGPAMTQKQIAALFGQPESAVSTAITAATFPSEVYACMTDPDGLVQRDVTALSKALKADRAGLLARARALATQGAVAAPQAVRALLAIPEDPTGSPAREVRSSEGEARLVVDARGLRVDVPARGLLAGGLRRIDDNTLRQLLESFVAQLREAEGQGGNGVLQQNLPED